MGPLSKVSNYHQLTLLRCVARLQHFASVSDQRRIWLAPHQFCWQGQGFDAGSQEIDWGARKQQGSLSQGLDCCLLWRLATLWQQVVHLGWVIGSRSPKALCCSYKEIRPFVRKVIFLVSFSLVGNLRFRTEWPKMSVVSKYVCSLSSLPQSFQYCLEVWLLQRG